jgi:phosphatidylserine/phosphatidylglycerophosphate/cardiolipin synthase-like enzyme
LFVSKSTGQDQFTSSRSRVFWGGPDRPPRYLRDLLEKRIHAVPSGGEILWVTYYFRDEGLASALLQAKGRGVKVRVAIEGTPRTGSVNRSVCQILGHHNGLGRGLRPIRHRVVDNRFFRTSRLHEKLYYFSHPEPNVLVGTFNPSGNRPEDPAIIKKIGDQDRGHNLLVNIIDPVLVAGLYEHGLHLFHSFHGPWERYLPSNNRVVASDGARILFFPRAKLADLEVLFAGFSPDSTLRIAASHLNDRGICKHLFALSRQGVRVEIIAHDTLRRVPSWVEKQMHRHGILLHRYIHPEGLPMHNKFMLIDIAGRQSTAYGSMNLSVRSLHANHELLIIDESAELYQIFQSRWHEMLGEVRCQKN